MKLTRQQIKALHVAARQAGLGEDERRLVQRNIGGQHSAGDSGWTRDGFIAVMAFYEQRCGGKLDGSDAGYWARQEAACTPADAIIHRIRQQGDAMGWRPDEIERFLAGPHCSRGAYTQLAGTPTYWLTRLLEAMKAIGRRATRKG
jgi:hypothetical protein